MRVWLRFSGLALILCLALVGRGLAAEIYWVQGAVALPDGRPVDNVAIYMDGQPAAYSGVSGLYFIPSAPPGTHLLQPVKQGFIFTPETVEVTLPPDTPDVNFTAFQAEGDQQTALRLPPVQEAPPPTPVENTWTLLQRLAGLLRQMMFLLLALSVGALLVLTARWLGSRGWGQPAEQRAEQAAEIVPPGQALAAPGEPDLASWLQQGIAFVQQGQPEQGLTRLRTVAQAQPGNAEAWFWLGEASLAQGERRTAQRCFRQAQRLGHPLASSRILGVNDADH